MAYGVTTLLTVRNSCKSQTDNVGQSFIADSEWNQYIGTAYYEVYGRIVTAFGNAYFTQTPAAGYTFTTDGINDHFALPTAVTGEQLMFKLLGVDAQTSAGQNTWVALREFSFSDRNRFTAFNGGIPLAGQLVRLLYVPRLNLPTADADLIDGVNGWEDWIVAKACVMALAKEESDVSVFMARLAALEKRLEDEIEARDASGQVAIVDIRQTRAPGLAYRLDGNTIWLQGASTPALQPYGYGDGYLGWW